MTATAREGLLIARAKDTFGDRVEDVIYMVQQDRGELEARHEPSHIWAAVTKSFRKAETTSDSAGAVELQTRTESDRRTKREAIRSLLEWGGNALKRIAHQDEGDLSGQELLGLESVLLFYGRPAISLDWQGRMGNVPPFWNVLEDQRENIEVAQRGVGRIELLGHPDFEWAGTGFLVSETAILTTRGTASLFIENRGDNWQFRPDMSAWMDYRARNSSVANARYRIRSVLGVHDRYDVALLEVEPPQHSLDAPKPLSLAAQCPDPLIGRFVYLIGYSVHDSRREEPDTIARIFFESYDVKRVQPGTLRGLVPFYDLQLLKHDCAPLGRSVGGCLIDLESHQVLGMQMSSRYLEGGVSVPLWVLSDDPLFQSAGVRFVTRCSGRMTLTETDDEGTMPAVSTTPLHSAPLDPTDWPEEERMTRELVQDANLLRDLGKLHLAPNSIRDLVGKEWDPTQALSAVARKRISDLLHLKGELEKVFIPEAIGPWLEQPISAFGGHTPLELIEQGDVGRLSDMIYLLQSGAPS